MATVRPAVKVPELDLKHLERMYGFRNKQEVLNFLCERPQIIPLLEEGRPKIDKFFGTEVRVVLEVAIDPESPDEESELFACIQTRLSVQEAHERMKLLDEDWALSAFAKSDGDLCVDMEFV